MRSFVFGCRVLTVLFTPDANGANITTTNTVENEHTYTIDWQPDQITWSIDGKVGRTLRKADTYNDTTKAYHYPQTPARVQMSLWPAGLSTNGEGTIAWAGGLVDWNSPYMQNGYYYAMVKNVSVECYDPPSGAKGSGDVYYYTSKNGMESDVAMGNNDTKLASFFASGNDMNKDPNAQTGTKTTASTMTATPETVPGMSGGGNQGLEGAAPGSGGSGSSSGDGNGVSGSSSGQTGGGSTTFSQGNGMDNTGNGNGGTNQASQIVAGSAVALLGFFVAALML